ncbi:MAG TPA: right-handed parallel beta-helix repeat-containing protein [Luteimonas sp.]|nr:right-handed parallel beta-helix repeat-containing protein [Luteimonas sp.]
MKKLCILAVLAASTQAPVAFAQSASCTEVASLPATLSQPGQYCLAKDFTVNSTSIKAITIAADDVTLDCRDHAIRNLAASNNGTSQGIYASSQHGVTVRNCRVLGGFTSGITFTQSNSVANKNYYITIENNYITGAYYHGIRAYGSALEVRNNRIYDVGGQLNTPAFGILLGASSVASSFKFHLVHDNAVVGTNSPYSNAYGVYSENSLAGLFWNNDVTGTTATKQNYRSYGFRILGSVNSIRDNQVVGSPLANDYGIVANSTSTDCYDNNIKSPMPTSGCDATLGNY